MLELGQCARLPPLTTCRCPHRFLRPLGPPVETFDYRQCLVGCMYSDTVQQAMEVNGVVFALSVLASTTDRRHMNVFVSRCRANSSRSRTGFGTSLKSSLTACLLATQCCAKNTVSLKVQREEKHHQTQTASASQERLFLLVHTQ